MFRNGNNNQAMQLLMQGYSDSIKAKTSNQTLAMANAFNDALGNAVKTHDNHEQAMQDRETTRLQNEYMNRTMDDRVKHQAQQTKANELANQYTERTLDDRVAHEEQRTLSNALDIEGQWLGNQFKTMENEVKEKTKGTEIDRINWGNKESVAASKLSEEKSRITLENYTGSTPVRQVGDKYQKLITYKDKKGNTVRDWEDTDEATFNRQKEINSNINYNRRTYGKTDTTANEMAVAQQQAQQANSVVAREMGDANFKAIKETQDLFKGQNYTPNEIAGLINDAERNQQSYIELSGGEKVDVLFAKQAIGYGLGGANGGGIGGGVNVNNSVKTTFKGDLANAINVLKNPNATPEELSAARSILLQDKNIQALNKKVNSYALLAQNAKDITDQDRLTTFQGFVTQYLGGNAASVYGNLKSKESMVLTELATNALKGALTERDMQIVRQQVQNLRKSGGFNEGVLRTMLDKMINEVEGAISTYETPHILAPDIYKKFESIRVLRGALD